MDTSSSLEGESPSELIDAKIRELDDWRAATLSRIRNLIKRADPEVVEESSLEGSVRRAIDVHDGEEIDEEAFKALIQAAVALNVDSVRRK